MDCYIYQADIYCEECGEAIKERLTKENKAPENPEDERTFDSGEYPKGPYSDGGGEADSPQHCGSHEDCLNAIELSDGSKIGCWLENPLTIDGVKYINEYIRDGKRCGHITEVTKLWYEWYKDYDLIPLEDAMQ